MAVVEIDEGPKGQVLRCEWFDEKTRKYERHGFLAVALEHAQDTHHEGTVDPSPPNTY
jgi:hypothetical protein